jgi:hypothetical protein
VSGRRGIVPALAALAHGGAGGAARGAVAGGVVAGAVNERLFAGSAGAGLEPLPVVGLRRHGGVRQHVAEQSGYPGALGGQLRSFGTEQGDQRVPGADLSQVVPGEVEAVRVHARGVGVVQQYGPQCVPEFARRHQIGLRDLSSLIAAGSTALPEGQATTASGTVNFGRQVASALGVAVLVTVLGGSTGLVHDFRISWLIGAALAVVGAVLALGLLERKTAAADASPVRAAG